MVKASNGDGKDFRDDGGGKVSLAPRIELASLPQKYRILFAFSWC
jgi:hypothetical protein